MMIGKAAWPSIYQVYFGRYYHVSLQNQQVHPEFYGRFEGPFPLTA